MTVIPYDPNQHGQSLGDDASRVKDTHKVRCPRCDIELDENYFLIKAFLTGVNEYDCPECGHELLRNE